MKRLLFTTTFALTSFLAASAFAQSIYDWTDAEFPAVVQDKGGLFFIDKTKTVSRVYKWKARSAKQGKAVFFADVDKNGQNNVVGGGTPLFVLDSNSDPIAYTKKGCNQILVADFSADNKMDVLCVSKKSIRLLTHDLQLIWEQKVSAGIAWCRAGDVNGDLKADAECKLKGKKFIRFDGAGGKQLATATDTEEVNNPVEPGLNPVGGDYLAGKTAFDFAGKGADAMFKVAGKTVTIVSKAGKTLGSVTLKSKPVAAFAKDIDGDKKSDAIVISKTQIAISNPDGTFKMFALKTGAYKRKPVAELQSVYTTGFPDDDKAKGAVDAVAAKLSKCYASQVKKNLFAGTGTILMEVSVNKKGKASNVQRHHSSLPDQKVAKCASSVLKKAKYDTPTGDSATVNVTLKYTFKDQ